MALILILDIGKTNKKAFVFDEDYRIVFEKSETLTEAVDDDGFPCEDLKALTEWIERTVDEIKEKFHLNAINVSAYGASFVHLGEDGEPVAPLYNYLKPFPEDLKKQFFDAYGGEEKLALETASPVLDHLNSGLQLYWLKYRNPLIFNKIKWALHLPQFVTWVIGRKIGWFSRPAEVGSDLTSLGCHTLLWDYQQNDYHAWVKAEGIVAKFPPVSSPPMGLHDSSAALIPYLATFKEPFLLISTGTWCISMNPFNEEPLTAGELAQDCLCYLTYEGRPVKAARYFGGHEHEEFVNKLAKEHHTTPDFYKQPLVAGTALAGRYEAFMKKLVKKQVASAKLAIGGSPVRHIFVDGGFSKNKTYMRLLASAFPEMEVFAATVAQATALGATLAIHKNWNQKEINKDLIQLEKIGG
ncbi:MAG: carbohydrate kinase [Saprospiraceae bacterium]|nr:carbohydrate kinase [Saprospiraceae bacterium]